MKKSLITGMFALGSILVHAQSEQLSKWFMAPYELDLTKPNAPLSGAISGAPAATKSYNCWYEAGQLLFYILDDGNVYDKNHNIICQVGNGNPLQGEIGIFPHNDNFTDLCSKKFWVIANAKNPYGAFPSLLTGYLYFTLIDLNAPNPVVSNTPALLSYSDSNPIAISKLKPGGKRHIYIGMPDALYPSMGVTYAFEFTGSTGTALINTMPGCKDGDMELSNAGDKLAYIDINGNAIVLPVNTTNGSTPATPTTTITKIESITGLEFDDTGNKLFYSENAWGGGGVFEYDFSNSTSTLVANTSSLGYSRLEKSFKNTGLTPYLICSGYNLSRIDITSVNTPALDLAWSPTVYNLALPDQIDGEDADDKMFTIQYPSSFKRTCTPGNFVIGYRVHPYILSYYSSLFTLEVNEIGNISGVYPQWQWYILDYPSLSATSKTLYVTATTSYRFAFYSNANPNNCMYSKTFSLYILPCMTVGTFSSSPGTPPPNGARITAAPHFPADETATAGFTSSWALQKLDPETHMPLYTVEGPGCWSGIAGVSNSFKGFNSIAHDYANESFMCSSTAGVFKIGDTYRVLRTVTKPPMDPVIYEDVFTVESPTTLKSMAAGYEENVITASSDETEMYPNPSTGLVSIKTNLSQSGIIEVFDMVGNKVQDLKVSDHETTTNIDLSALSKGIYTIRISAGNYTSTKKITLQ